MLENTSEILNEQETLEDYKKGYLIGNLAGYFTGKYEIAVSVAHKMKQLNVDIQMISKCTRLSEKEIEDIDPEDSYSENLSEQVGRRPKYS